MSSGGGAGPPATGLVLDDRFLRHDTGPGHPERPDRLRSVDRALGRAGLTARLTRVEPREATDEELERAHEPDQIRRIAEACAAGALQIDSMDTAICRASERVARLAAGSVVELCRRTARGDLASGFAAIRPPGHHAERDLAMGFCLFNNVVVAARAVQADERIERVLIVDWDVHHGNGTQHILESDGSIFYFSVHQSPLYPGTGERSERGIGGGEGATLNCPLPPGAGDEAFLATLGEQLADAASSFRPDFVIVSAGFDAHTRDPLGGLEVTTPAFAEATRIVRGIAAEHAGGRLVSVLEGGYDLEALGDSVVAHLEQLV